MKKNKTYKVNHKRARMKLKVIESYFCYLEKENNTYVLEETSSDGVVYDSIDKLREVMCNIYKQNKYTKLFMLKETQNSFILFQKIEFEDRIPKLSRVVLKKIK